MDFTPYLRELDVELTQLKAVRRMLMELREPVLLPSPAPVRRKKAVLAKTVVAMPVAAEPVVVEPTLTVVPPKQKREYQRRGRGVVEARAIGGTIPDRPVFVRPMVVAPKVTVATPVEMDAAAMEAAVRRKFLGQVA